MNYSSNYATSKSWVKGDLVNVSLFLASDKISRRPIYIPIIPLAEPVIYFLPNKESDKLRNEFQPPVVENFSESEDSIVVNSKIVPHLIALAKKEPVSDNWEREIDEL